MLDEVSRFLRHGFALAGEADAEVRQRIAAGVLVHVTKLASLRRGIVTARYAAPRGAANCEVVLDGTLGLGGFGAKAMRDHRVVDWDIFRGTNFVYFFLGEPDAGQIRSQALDGGQGGAQATIRVRGSDLLVDPSRRIFYRQGLFGLWEADRAVIVKGGYRGPAAVDPLPHDLDVRIA